MIVLHSGNDICERRSHNGNMAKRPAKRPDLAKYEAYREASGWYLAAWRNFRKLTLDELAAAYGEGTSRGRVSDFETGAVRKDTGKVSATISPQALKDFAAALNTTPGKLIDVNPFAVDQRFTTIEQAFQVVDDRDRDELTRLAETLMRRHTGEAA